MSKPGTGNMSDELSGFVEKLLKRSLSPEEQERLSGLQSDWQSGKNEVENITISPETAKEAQAVATQTIAKDRQRANSTINDILGRAHSPNSAKILTSEDREKRAILRILETTPSLNDLRPSSLKMTATGISPNGRLLLTQIAECLATLVKKEVEKFFHEYFAGLQKKLQQALNEVKTIAQNQAQQASQPAKQLPAPNQKNLGGTSERRA